MGGDVKVTKTTRHRNGVSGEPFGVVLFESEGRTMVGIVFDEPTYTAVLDVNLLAGGVIGMFEGTGNAWRGDNFEKALRDALAERKNFVA